MIGCILKMLRQTLFFTIVLFLSNQSDAISRKATPRASNYPLEADLEIEDLVAYHGYNLESHEVQTEDGYILTIHRIPHGQNNADITDKPVVLMMPGVFCSSACFVIRGAENSTAYVLANAGYDVWIGNPRGTTYSRRHVSLDPDVDKQSFWEFSFHEMGYYDLPATIDYILQTTGQENMFYIGHSQGTTSFLVLAAEKPEYNTKIRLMTALAPISFMSNIPNPVLQVLAKSEAFLSFIASTIDFHEIFPHWDIYTEFGKQFCNDASESQEFCSQLWSLFGGNNEAQFNKTLLPVIFSKIPAGCSVKQFVHFGQEIASGKFRQFDYGILNLIVYGNLEPPSYDLTHVTSPVALFYGANDQLASPEDVAVLAENLPNVVFTHLIDDELFTHTDFMLANDLNRLLHDALLELMQNY